jgi:hypothetical protein
MEAAKDVLPLTEAQKRHISFFHPETLVNEGMLMETVEMPDLAATGGAIYDRSPIQILRQNTCDLKISCCCHKGAEQRRLYSHQLLYRQDKA